MGMDIVQPRLETERLILEAYRESDVRDIFAYASDEDVARFVLWQAHKTEQDSKAFYDWIQTSTTSKRGELFFVFAIRHKQDQRVIGSIDFKNAYPHCGQIDYALGKNYWGQGLVTEAAVAVRDWAYATLPEMVRFQSYCIPENIGSSRVMQKLGMEYEGLRKKALVVKGKPVDIVYYAHIR